MGCNRTTLRDDQKVQNLQNVPLEDQLYPQSHRGPRLAVLLLSQHPLPHPNSLRSRGSLGSTSCKARHDPSLLVWWLRSGGGVGCSGGSGLGACVDGMGGWVMVVMEGPAFLEFFAL